MTDLYDEPPCRSGKGTPARSRLDDINFDGVTWEQVESYWRVPTLVSHARKRPIGWTEEDERKLQSPSNHSCATQKIIRARHGKARFSRGLPRPLLLQR